MNRSEIRNILRRCLMVGQQVLDLHVRVRVLPAQSTPVVVGSNAFEVKERRSWCYPIIRCALVRLQCGDRSLIQISAAWVRVPYCATSALGRFVGNRVWNRIGSAWGPVGPGIQTMFVPPRHGTADQTGCRYLIRSILYWPSLAPTSEGLFLCPTI